MRMLVVRGYVQAVGRDEGPGQADLVRDDLDVPGADGARFDRGPASARQCSSRRLSTVEMLENVLRSEPGE